MKFSRIQVQRFGPLTRIDSGEKTALPGLVAVLGPNEAGKSAFHDVLGSILYGFQPARGDSHPFAPWGGGNIEIGAQIEVEGDEALVVHRRLLKTPHGSSVQGKQVEKLGNRPLSVAGHIDRRVYSEVYAITLAQLAGLSEAAWETVQEQLIVGMGAHDLRSTRAVIRGFRDAAKKLWQPTKRGKQRHRELRTQLAELAQARKEAEVRDHELRDVDRELSGLRLRLAELGQEKSAGARELETLRELLPFRSRLTKLDELGESIGDRGALADAPRDPVTRDRELTDRMHRSKQRIDQLTETLNQIRSGAGSLSETERRILERSASLQALSSNAPLVNERLSRRTNLENEISSIEGGLSEASLPLLGRWPTRVADSDTLETEPVDWNAAGAGFRSLEMSALRERVAEAEDRSRRREDLEDRLRELAGRTPPRTPFTSLPVILLTFASVVTLLGGLFIAAPIVVGIGVSLLILASGALTRTWSQWSATRQVREVGFEEQDKLRDRISEVERQEQLAVASARELLIPLGLQASHLDAPSGSVVSDIGELKNLFHLRQERLVELGRLADEEAVLASEFERLVTDLDVHLPEDHGLALLELGRMLQQLEQRRVRIDEVKSEETRIEAALSSEREEYEEGAKLRREFEESVERAGETTDTRGLERLAQRLADLELTDGLAKELVKEAGDLPGLRRRVEEADAAGLEWSDDPDHLSREQSRLDGLDQEGLTLRERVGVLQEREKALMGEDTSDLVDGQILDLRVTLREVEAERDRKVLFARLVEKAEGRFRDEHQPDLLRRAEEHLSAITVGRYERLLVGKQGDDQGFFLDATHLPEPTAVATPLSTGTREQVYFALRLAIVEHLDREAEPLPLLLDEVLANWDPERRARVLDLLERLAPFRQVFVFTCHPHVAEEVAARGGLLLSLTPSEAA